MLTHFIILKIREREVERDLPSIVLLPPKTAVIRAGPGGSQVFDMIAGAQALSHVY